MPRPDKPDYEANAKKTAMSRVKISAPTRMLLSTGRIPKGASVLNHGSGKATHDAAALAAAAAEYAEFDLYWANNPEVLERRYDVVVSNYVLNVCRPEMRKSAWQDIARTTGGVAYISVRSTGDSSIKGKKHKDGITTKLGTFQKAYTAASLTREAKKYFSNVEVIAGRPSGISWTIAASDPKISGEGEPETTQQRDKPATLAKVPKQKKAAPVDAHKDNDDAEIETIKRLAGMNSE
jgi:hypothetical protein